MSLFEKMKQRSDRQHAPAGDAYVEQQQTAEKKQAEHRSTPRRGSMSATRQWRRKL